jgi:transposase InsO family protein
VARRLARTGGRREKKWTRKRREREGKGGKGGRATGQRRAEKERERDVHGCRRRKETSKKARRRKRSVAAVPDLRSRAIFTLVSALLARRLEIPAGSNRGPVY